MAAERAVGAIRARRPRFDLSQTPTHWIPEDPQTTHTINVLHLLLPPGERWFCDVYREALPLVTDDELREDIKGFMGQEAVHARAHDLGIDYLRTQGIDCTWFEERAEWMRRRIGGPEPLGLKLKGRWPRRWLNRRLAVIAAVEHYTSVLGTWVVEDSAGLDEAGADPVMMDMLRWHGAEEVEHRSVAYDTYQHLCGSYPVRVITMVGVSIALISVWVACSVGLLKVDPHTHTRFRPSEFRRAVRQGRLPSLLDILRAIPRYLERDHHPSKEPGSRDLALAYLKTSPGLRGESAA